MHYLFWVDVSFQAFSLTLTLNIDQDNGFNKYIASIRSFIQVQRKTHLFCFCFLPGCRFTRGGEKVCIAVPYFRLFNDI